MMAESDKTPERIAEERIQQALQSQTTELDLSRLELTVLPQSIAQLKKLQVLRAVRNQLTVLPESLVQLKELRGLYIWRNRLTELPDDIGELGQLDKLDVSKNCLGALPESIGRLSQLRGLYAQNNELREVPEGIGQLRQLQWLYLSENKLKALPDTLRQLHSLREIYLHGNEQLGIPREILGARWEDVSNTGAMPTEAKRILRYYFLARGGSWPLNEAKLILIGRGAVGKTCVVNRLERNVFEDTSKTQGISITQWPIRLKGEEDVRLHVWDFGGQEIMHATHQFFLTERSLYVLVLTGREGGEDAEAEYWLQFIESFGGDSPVIVVLNKISEHPFDLNRRALQGKYPAVREFVRVDCKDGTGIDDLRGAIHRETDTLKDLRTAFPASWVAIKDRLSNMAEKRENHISFERYRELCAELGEKDPEAQEALAGYLHSLGIALNYKDDPRLHDINVLSPQWVTNGIYKILNWSELEARKGVLRLRDLTAVLDSNTYPTTKHLFLLDLMKKFEICFEFPDDPERRYLLPELLGKEEPPVAGEFDPAECLNFEYDYNILPEGLLPRFIVRTHPLSRGKARWRTGVVLEFEGNRALVKADVHDRKTFISVTGQAAGQRRLLAVIRSDFERIHADIKKIQVTEMVPVPRRPEAVVQYSKLKTLEQRGIPKFIEVFDSDVVELDVKELLNGVDIEGSRLPEPELERRTRGVRVFISYSHQDEALRAELETHLKLLQRQGTISVWHDRKITAGVEWAGQIDRNLEAAEMILLLVSADFIGSDYCYDKEMKRALERHEAGSARTIPIILRDVDWHSAPFGKLQPLPKEGRPVTLWENKDSAWKDVALGIRKAVEEIKALSFGRV
jgi:internalin A